jgi:unsaturated rhamnogalacturonyl hydrolase
MQTEGLAAAQPVNVEPAWCIQMADSAIARYTASSAKWHYEHGLLLKSIEQVWLKTGAAKYWQFIQTIMDLWVEVDGRIRTYQAEEHNLDQVNQGRLLFPLYRITGEQRYRGAIDLMRSQLAHQPRTHSGGFWHKLIYPYQMWLDGLYMACPFYAEHAQTFDDPAGFDDVVHQLCLIEKQARDPNTGLLYHAWDESKQQRWADPVSGCSPHFWGRGVGWYAMALVDVLDYVPEDHVCRSALIAILLRLAEAVAKVQDPSTGLWYQVLDQGAREGNYLESSASCMFVYAIAKAVRKAYLPADYATVAQRGYRGITTHFITIDDRGQVNLERTCSVAGLGGDPYRDGSYEYYIGEPTVTNDLKGVGAFLLAAVEIEGRLNGTTKRSESAG